MIFDTGDWLPQELIQVYVINPVQHHVIKGALYLTQILAIRMKS